MGNLKGISTYCNSPNQSGLLQIEYAPLDAIDVSLYEQIIDSSYNFQYDIIFKEGAWFSAPILFDNRMWEEKQRINVQGVSYSQIVKGIAPLLRPEVALEFGNMANRQFLLRLTDRDGKKWLLGTPETPFNFFADGTTGDGKSLKSHKIRFESISVRKAFGFEPKLTP